MNDKVLIRLHRQYSKDEYVSHLHKKIKEKDLEIGMLTSERDESQYICDELKHHRDTSKEINRDAKIRVKMDEKWKSIKAENKHLRLRLKEMTAFRDKLLFKKQ